MVGDVDGSPAIAGDVEGGSSAIVGLMLRFAGDVEGGASEMVGLTLGGGD